MSLLSTNIETRESLFLTAGTTPGFNVGDNKYTNIVTDENSSLTGWDFNVSIRALGSLKPSIEYAVSGEIIQLTNEGYSIALNEVWVIDFQPRQVLVPNNNGPVDYSNGYHITDVMNALLGRRRWRQPTTSEFPYTLAADLVWGSGDNYSPVFESEHKIVDVFNIFNNQGDEGITQDGFNEYLRNLNRDNILKCLNNVFTKKENLEKKLLFERFGRQDYINLNERKFVGVRILPARQFDVSCQIDNVALKFDANVTFNLYLFHDTQPQAPLAIFPVSAVAFEQTIVNVGKILSYAGSGNKSGVFYFGYFQNDLGSVHAINEIIERFNPMFRFGMVPIELANPSGTIIDVNNVSFTMKTHGFNIQVSAFRDFTQLIIDNAHLFDNLIGLQMAADVIELINNSVRTNKDQRVNKELSQALYMDLNLAQTTEERPFSTGLKTRIFREYARVRNEFYPKKRTVSITHDTDNNDIYGVPPPVIDVFKY